MGRHARSENALDAVGAVHRRLEEWAAIAPGGGPEYLTTEHNAANLLVAQWMAEAGLVVAEDGLGNVIGRHPSAGGTPQLLLGAHLGQVGDPHQDAVLGLAVAIEAIGRLGAALPNPAAVGVIALADPGGARFGRPDLSAHAASGTFEREWLDLQDLDGITVREAATAFALDPDQFTVERPAPSAFLFVDIDAQLRHAVSGHTLGVGLLMAARSTVEVEVVGIASTVGTPAGYRRDAVAAVAELIAVAEQLGATGSGRIAVSDVESCPPAGLVPGRARFLIDVCERTDAAQRASWQQLLQRWHQVTHRRGVRLSTRVQAQTPMADCADWLTAAVVDAISSAGQEPIRLAGYDQGAVSAFARRADVGWLALAGLDQPDGTTDGVLGGVPAAAAPTRGSIGSDRISSAVTVLAGAMLRITAQLRSAAPVDRGLIPTQRSGAAPGNGTGYRGDGTAGRRGASYETASGTVGGNVAGNFGGNFAGNLAGNAGNKVAPHVG